MDGEIKAIIDSIKDEDNRQNHRIDNLECEVKAIREIATSIKELTLEIKHLREDVQTQGERLTKIENAPLDRINGAKSSAINTIIGIMAGALATGLILLMAQNL